MISTFRPERSAELAPKVGEDSLAEAQAPLLAEVAPVAALAPTDAQLEVSAPIPCPQLSNSTSCQAPHRIKACSRLKVES
jgi:hypothetical protein